MGSFWWLAAATFAGFVLGVIVGRVTLGHNTASYIDGKAQGRREAYQSIRDLAERWLQ